MAVAGDIDGDGTNDVLVGAPADAGPATVGSVIVFSGGDGAVLEKLEHGAYELGQAVAGGHDLDGDGTPDIVASAGAGGRATVFSGADGAALWQLDEPDPQNSRADRMVMMPDISGDDVAEIVLGRSKYTGSTGERTGRVLIFSGANGDLLEDLRDPSTRAGDEIGCGVSTADLTGDGVPDDVVAGATGHESGEGRVVFFARQADCDGDGEILFGGRDCDDNDSDTYGGAVETNDGRDNQCPGDPGYGVVDEITGDAGFHDPLDKTIYSWPPQQGATSYEVARDSHSDFAGPCQVSPTSSASFADGEPPPVGGAWYYLVRSTGPNLGSWGTDSSGTEREEVCP